MLIYGPYLLPFLAIFACLLGIQWQLLFIHRRLVRTERRASTSNQFLINLGANRIPDQRGEGDSCESPGATSRKNTSGRHTTGHSSRT